MVNSFLGHRENFGEKPTHHPAGLSIAVFKCPAPPCEEAAHISASLEHTKLSCGTTGQAAEVQWPTKGLSRPQNHGPLERSGSSANSLPTGRPLLLATWTLVFLTRSSLKAPHLHPGCARASSMDLPQLCGCTAQGIGEAAGRVDVPSEAGRLSERSPLCLGELGSLPAAPTAVTQSPQRPARAPGVLALSSGTPEIPAVSWKSCSSLSTTTNDQRPEVCASLIRWHRHRGAFLLPSRVTACAETAAESPTAS